jgi:hypothetical protein
MKNMWKGGIFILVAIALIAAIVMATGRQQALAGTRDNAQGAGPHYSVVMTEGHNLLVTDNATNKIYFYTVDKDKPIGSPLKLRASVDLTKVGEDEIKITAHNLEGTK